MNYSPTATRAPQSGVYAGVVPTRPSRTARTIAERLGADGLDVAATSVQFWAEKGLLGESHQTWSGGGGSEVAYPDDALEVVRIIHFWPRRSRHRSDVVLACFSRGLTVTEQELRDALLTEVEALRESVGEDVLAKDGEDVVDAANDVAADWVARRRRPAGLRRWARNSAGWKPTGSDGTPESDTMGNDERLRFMLSAVLAAIGGEPSSLEPAIGGLLAAEAAGRALDLAAVESGRNRVDIESEIAKAATVMVERLGSTPATVELEEMVGARRAVLALARAGSDAEALAPLEGPLAPLGSACRLVAMSALALVIEARRGAVSLEDLVRVLSG